MLAYICDKCKQSTHIFPLFVHNSQLELWLCVNVSKMIKIKNLYTYKCKNQPLTISEKNTKILIINVHKFLIGIPRKNMRSLFLQNI